MPGLGCANRDWFAFVWQHRKNSLKLMVFSKSCKLLIIKPNNLKALKLLTSRRLTEVVSE